ncbi:hypothetical protein EJ08DRAFT_691512 [Tothia fuscella]|uniref:Uncharacterized protein n=1 Tax=Tothia fuscella TaxID=1048955 RepID=A0A9P4P312_9PEZI|nr:hypothetical protein EJ08DRAFT_691512 [Tothia fuscella]
MDAFRCLRNIEMCTVEFAEISHPIYMLGCPVRSRAAFDNQFRELASLVCSSAPFTDTKPRLDLYDRFLSAFGHLYSFRDPRTGLVGDMDVAAIDKEAWSACDEGNLEKFQTAKREMLVGSERVQVLIRSRHEWLDEEEKKVTQNQAQSAE